MESVFFLSATTGKTERGEYYKITLNIHTENGGRENDYAASFFVDAEMYAKTKTFKRFEEVDARFIPNSKGLAVLVALDRFE